MWPTTLWISSTARAEFLGALHDRARGCCKGFRIWVAESDGFSRAVFDVADDTR